MAGALVRLLASLLALFMFAAIGRCETGTFYPISGAMAHAHLADVFSDDTHIGSAGFSANGQTNARTIPGLTDEEEALLARRFIGADPDGKHQPADAETYVASLQIAAALGAAVQWLAALWDPRLTIVLVWLFFLALLLRPPRWRPNASQAKTED
ncbi:MAG: hypothetical protein WCF20_08365 [Methylovirgula sp.]